MTFSGHSPDVVRWVRNATRGIIDAPECLLHDAFYFKHTDQKTKKWRPKNQYFSLQGHIQHEKYIFDAPCY